jgi:hypothetical protein
VLIFNHVPKTSGATLGYSLRRLYGPDAVIALYGIERRRDAWFREWFATIPSRARSRLQCVAGHEVALLVPLLDEPPRIFSLLRDPVDRAISLYTFLTTRYDAGIDMSPAAADIRERGWSLADIYRNADTAPPRLADFFNAQVRRLTLPYRIDRFPFAPIAPADVPDDMTQLQQTLDAFYTLGVQERHDASVARFARTFGWGDLRTDMANVTPGRCAVTDLPADVVDLIRSYNQLDIALHERAMREVHAA